MMKRLSWLLVISVLYLITVLEGSGKEYYVSANGDDNNPGTKAKPFNPLPERPFASMMVFGEVM